MRPDPLEMKEKIVYFCSPIIFIKQTNPHQYRAVSVLMRTETARNLIYVTYLGLRLNMWMIFSIVLVYIFLFF